MFLALGIIKVLAIHGFKPFEPSLAYAKQVYRLRLESSKSPVAIPAVVL
jgi:hypothetical protein